MGEIIPFLSREYFLLLSLLAFSRAMDFLSTWIATPNLVLEGNPLAKKLGWKWGITVNAGVCLLFALWALPAIVICTTSLLVATRNFQSAWLMHSLGEERYREWFIERLQHTSLPLYLLCLVAQTVLTAGIGAALMAFSGHDLIPLGIGLGIITYAVAVAFYTLLALWRLRRVFI
jgi:hypothetical protein